MTTYEIYVSIYITLQEQVANIERQVASRVAAAALSANTLLTTHSSPVRTAIPSDSAAVHDPKPAALNSSSANGSASATSSSTVVRDSGARMSGNREDAAVAVQARYRGYRARKGTASGESRYN
jgi:IQ calmodulin-binding motif